MKRTLSLVLALVMVLGTFTTVFAAEEPTAVEVAGKFLEQEGVLKGDDKTGDLMLDENLKRQDMVVLFSRLMGVEDVAKDFAVSEDMAWEDIADPYYAPYLSWAFENKLVKGESEEKFGFDNPVKSQDFAALLLRVLGYEDEILEEGSTDSVWENALKDAKELGILENLDVKDNVVVPRGTIAVMTFNALSVKVKDSEETLAEKLEIEMPVPEVLEVEEVVADNLREVKVVFNKDVDVDLEDIELYSISGGIKVSDAVVEDNMLVLSVAKMLNKRAYKLVIKGTEDVDGTYDFTVYDNQIPHVVDVKALGTKAIKVTMSEPVQDVRARDFRLNDKSYFGAVNVTGREIILTPYGSVLTVGSHTLTVLSLKDDLGFKSIETRVEFEVLEDKVAPEVVSVTGTLERLVVTFSEDVDDASVKASSLYWNNKANTGTPTRLAGNKYAFEFSEAKALPIYEVTLYIQGVKDYSGNTMKDVEMPFKGELDDVRPEVVSAKLKDADEIVVEFSKSVLKEDANNEKNYTLLDEKGNVVRIRSAVLNNNKEVTVTSYRDLAKGKTYTLKIQGIRDTTKLRNTMLPFEGTVDVAGSPTANKVSAVVGTGRQIHVQFSKEMDLATIGNMDNYILTTSTGTKLLSAVNVENFEIIDGGKAVVIELPEKIDKVDVTLGESGTVTHITVVGAKDVAGNLISNHGEPQKIVTDQISIKEAVAESKTKVVVEFTQNVYDISASAFVIGDGVEVTNAYVNGTAKVELTVKELKANANANTVTVKAGSEIETILGKVETEKASTVNLKDEIAPSFKELVPTKGQNTFALKFDEELDAAFEAVVAQDIKIERLNTGKFLTSGIDFTATLNNDEITIELKVDLDLQDGEEFGISIEKPKFIYDKHNNLANELSEKVYTYAVLAEDVLAEQLALVLDITLAEGIAENETNIKAIVESKVDTEVVSVEVSKVEEGKWKVTLTLKSDTSESGFKDIIVSKSEA